MELNKERTGVELKLYDLTVKIVDECGYKLYDVEYIPASSTLRVYIMDEKTKSAVIEDCIAVDRAFSPYCEEENWIPDDFVLEVSSPGVFRNIKTKEHFDLSLGEIISLTIFGKLAETQSKDLPAKLRGSNKFRGKVLSVKDENFEIEIEGISLSLTYEQVKRVNLDPDINN